jgi:phenylpropionate dioxygenase-like ring-hydroxylating dioxygenase large terminal subunit
MMVARVKKAWYVLCSSRELRRKPISRKLFGEPLVLFRGEDGKPGALLDRCAHRNVPLSLGRVVPEGLECSYHGWRFDRGGGCRRIPGLSGDPEKQGRSVPGFAAREEDGYVWVYATPCVEPEGGPFRIPLLREKGYTSARKMVEVESSVHAAIENALDVPHTAFLHRGLFRGTGKTNPITAVVTRTGTGVQAEYIGEPRPEGLAGKILAPSGGKVIHHDRFILPSVAQVEYRLGEDAHLLVTSLCTPVDDFVTRMFAVISFRMRLPGWLVKAVLHPVGMSIFRQDARILAEQTRSLKRFGGESFTSTGIDLLGLQVWRLLRMAEGGTLPGETDDGWRREIKMEA